jgi:hypothetical protein
MREVCRGSTVAEQAEAVHWQPQQLTKDCPVGRVSAPGLIPIALGGRTEPESDPVKLESLRLALSENWISERVGVCS